MEEAIKTCSSEVKKLEDEISTILKTLISQGQLKAVESAPLSLSPVEGLADSSSRMEVDDDDFADDNAARGEGRMIYELDSSSIFLSPFGEKFVLGLTVRNTSAKTQNLPEVLLSFEPAEKEGQGQRQSFSYRVKCSGLPVPVTGNPGVEAEDISYYDPFAEEERIPPGGDVLITASFEYPLTFLLQTPAAKGNKDDREKGSFIVVSLFLEGIQLWAKSVPISEDALMKMIVQGKRDDHSLAILKGCTVHKEAFRMNRLLSHGEKSPQRAVEKFLLSLGFEKLQEYPLGIDSSLELYAFKSNEQSPLSGATFQVEKCSRNVNQIRCILGTRSLYQHQIFLRFFTSWLDKEGRHERKKGLSGLTVSPLQASPSTNSPVDYKSYLSLLTSEISVISSMMDEQVQKQKQKSLQILQDFVENTFATDKSFMQI